MHEGNILKMKGSLDGENVFYKLPIGDELVDMNALIGTKIKFTYTGQINCIDTGERISKSYAQGFSYKSFISKAACDLCIMKPETCHFDKGTCREPEWAKSHCFRPHYVYLSNTGNVKVGITRDTQIPTRWIDQGAEEALAILRVKDRMTSGLLEVEIKNFVGDKTNWRKMLKGGFESVDLYAVRDEIFDSIESIIDDFDAEMLEEDQVMLKFPVQIAPDKVKSLSFDKSPIIEGVLNGIKGQYLILDTGVLNMRKHQGYYLYLETE
jgi:hypothetical protein